MTFLAGYSRDEESSCAMGRWQPQRQGRADEDADRLGQGQTAGQSWRVDDVDDVEHYAAVPRRVAPQLPNC